MGKSRGTADAGSQAVVKGGAAMKHKFDEPSLKKMFYSIFCMVRLYRNRAWPATRSDWEADLTDELGLTGLSAILFGLEKCGYVKVSGGKGLLWNKEKLLDAVTRMPEHLKKTNNDVTDLVSRTVDAQRPFQLSNGTMCYFIDTADAFDAVLIDPIFNDGDDSPPTTVALDCEGVPDALELIQIATEKLVYIFDCKLLGTSLVCQKLNGFMKSTTVTKLIHDLHKDAVALDRFGSVKLEGVLDTQLLAEHLWGDIPAC